MRCRPGLSDQQHVARSDGVVGHAYVDQGSPRDERRRHGEDDSQDEDDCGRNDRGAQ